MNSEDEESRSGRLRRRRSRRQQQSERDETDDISEPDELDETSKRSKPTVKEEQVGTYMYLPRSQKKELDRLYNVLKAEYEYEFDQEFEKNRHFFPLVIQYGLDSLDSLDASDIQDRLDSI